MAPVAALLARMGRAGFSAGAVTGPAQGNAVVRSDARGAAAAQPGKGAGGGFRDGGISDASPYPEREIITPPAQLLLRARTDAYQRGRLIARDRHIAAYRGRTTSSDTQSPTGGSPNPEADGPPRPSYRMLNRTLSWQIGTDSTAHLDNTAFHATTTAGNRAFALGTQDGSVSKTYGGTRGLYLFRAYGSRRGYTGGPAPRVVALPGGPARPGTVISLGSPDDGPQQIWGGYPHGLSTVVAEPARVTAATIKARYDQIRKPRVNRPNNSKVAGQSYDQAVVHLNGTQAVRLPRIAPGRQPGINGRLSR